MCNVDLLFFDATPTTQTHTLSLHDALPILLALAEQESRKDPRAGERAAARAALEEVSRRSFSCSLSDLQPEDVQVVRSEEHTSELQSPCNIVCRLLLEKKNKIKNKII